MFADAFDAGHLLVGQGAVGQRGEVLGHLEGGGWCGKADVHVGVGEDKAVAMGGSKRCFAGGHVPCLEQFAPARSGEDHDTGAVFPGQVGEDVLLGAPVDRVVAHLEHVDGQVELAADDAAYEGTLVTGYADEAYLVLVLQFQGPIK